jgi:hypothetical protein
MNWNLPTPWATSPWDGLAMCSRYWRHDVCIGMVFVFVSNARRDVCCEGVWRGAVFASLCVSCAVQGDGVERRGWVLLSRECG